MSNPIQVAGGGSFPEQQTAIVVQPEVHIIQPPPDNTLLWVSGVAVPLLIATIGWWIHIRRKN